MRRRVSRRLIVIHAAWKLKTTDLESILKTGDLRGNLEKWSAWVSHKFFNAEAPNGGSEVKG